MGTDNDILEDFDTEIREISPITPSGQDIIFSTPSGTWQYISENEYNDYMAECIAVKLENPYDQLAEKVLASKYLKGNDSLNISAEQVSLLYLYDQWGAKLYLTGKNDKEFTRNVYRILTNKEPMYYSWVDGSWTISPNWTSSSYSEADACLTYCDPPYNLVLYLEVSK